MYTLITTAVVTKAVNTDGYKSAKWVGVSTFPLKF